MLRHHVRRPVQLQLRERRRPGTHNRFAVSRLPFACVVVLRRCRRCRRSRDLLERLLCPLLLARDGGCAGLHRVLDARLVACGLVEVLLQGVASGARLGRDGDAVRQQQGVLCLDDSDGVDEVYVDLLVPHCALRHVLLVVVHVARLLTLLPRVHHLLLSPHPVVVALPVRPRHADPPVDQAALRHLVAHGEVKHTPDLSRAPVLVAPRPVRPAHHQVAHVERAHARDVRRDRQLRALHAERAKLLGACTLDLREFLRDAAADLMHLLVGRLLAVLDLAHAPPRRRVGGDGDAGTGATGGTAVAAAAAAARRLVQLREHVAQHVGDGDGDANLAQLGDHLRHRLVHARPLHLHPVPHQQLLDGRAGGPHGVGQPHQLHEHAVRQGDVALRPLADLGHL
eukprot:Rhum_TRINITY_DN14600_c9_g3::Rhum_TRINITY_DN14600_c9_g3_i1::g.102541::m.102541